ncbi:hypothetical protein ACTA71_006696 [Dictyostelium dimigraforme]
MLKNVENLGNGEKAKKSKIESFGFNPKQMFKNSLKFCSIQLSLVKRIRDTDNLNNQHYLNFNNTYNNNKLSSHIGNIKIVVEAEPANQNDDVKKLERVED